jgi:hypothetical protein
MILIFRGGMPYELNRQLSNATDSAALMIPRPIRWPVWSCLTAFYPELCIGGQLYYVSRFSFGVINWPPDGGICTGVKRSVN